jgi:Na+-driven multidrug efflux pump
VGKGSISFTLAVIRQLVFNIPILLLMNSVSGMNGIIWTQFIADGCTALVSFIIYRKTAANIIK